jgi:endoglucanase Acf2
VKISRHVLDRCLAFVGRQDAGIRFGSWAQELLSTSTQIQQVLREKETLKDAIHKAGHSRVRTAVIATCSTVHTKHHVCRDIIVQSDQVTRPLNTCRMLRCSVDRRTTPQRPSKQRSSSSSVNFSACRGHTTVYQLETYADSRWAPHTASALLAGHLLFLHSFAFKYRTILYTQPLS